MVPLRIVSRLKDLSEEESIDYMMTLQKIHTFIEKEYKADSLNIATQDGAAAGQTVPHLHTHIIPRYFADGYGDSIYAELDHHEGALKKYQESLRKPAKLEVPDDAAREPRTMEEMKIEADLLSNKLQVFLNK